LPVYGKTPNKMLTFVLIKYVIEQTTWQSNRKKRST
jgi:hypothetical protein